MALIWLMFSLCIFNTTFNIFTLYCLHKSISGFHMSVLCGFVVFITETGVLTLELQHYFSAKVFPRFFLSVSYLD